MALARIDTGFLRNPKIVAVGKDGTLLQLAGILYCSDGLTDGFIPKKAVPILGASAMVRSASRTAALLVAAGLWEESGDGYRIHDFLQYQPSRDAALSRRTSRAEAGRRGGQAKALANAKQTLEQLPSNSSSKTVAKGLANATAFATTPPAPSPLSPPQTPPLSPLPHPQEKKPHSSSGAKKAPDGAPRAQKRTEAPSVSPEFEKRQIDRFGPLFGEEWVRVRIERALNHKKALTWINVERGVTNWLREDAENAGGGADAIDGSRARDRSGGQAQHDENVRLARANGQTDIAE